MTIAVNASINDGQSAAKAHQQMLTRGTFGTTPNFTVRLRRQKDRS